MTEFLKGYAAGANDMEAGRLVTKPFTDEDVERVADVLSRARMCDAEHVHAEPFGYWTGDTDRELARAALSAYLEPTTKGDT